MSNLEMGEYIPPEAHKAKEIDNLGQRTQEALEAFQTKFPWIKEGAKFKFSTQAPKPMEGVFRKEVYAHDFTDATFTADGFFHKSKDGNTIQMGAETQITIIDEEGKESNPKIHFDFMVDEIDGLGIEEVK